MHLFSLVALIIMGIQHSTSTSYSKPECKSNSISARVEALLKQMTIEEKVGQMTQINTGTMIDRQTLKLDSKLVNYYCSELKVGSFLNLPIDFKELPPPTPQEWLDIINTLQESCTSTRLKIPMLYGLDSVHGANYVYGATLFPQQLGLACTFNRTLAEKVAHITGKDTRAVGVGWNFSPILDIAVNKQWPRTYETFGECPYLVSELGKYTIKGYQGDECGSSLKDKDRVAATMKHFIGYSNSRSGKDVDGSWMSYRTVNDYFRPPFQIAIQNKVATAMESYSDIDGDHLVNSKLYLVDLLRKEMSFDGTLVTDYQQIEKLHEPIHIAATLEEAIRKVIKLETVDMSMVPDNGNFTKILIDLVKTNQIPETIIDTSVRRILDLKERLGLLDSDGKVAISDLATIGQPQDQLVSLEGARQSIVLLQNLNSFLPLAKSSKLLVTGPTADSLSYLTGGWTFNWQGTTQDSWFQNKGTTILQGLQKEFTSVQHRPTVDINGDLIEKSALDTIVTESKDYDVIVVCLGEVQYTEFKGNINDMYLPVGQRNLMDRLILESNKPVVVILSQGRPRVTTFNTTKLAKGVLVNFLAGPYAGQAIAEILVGTTNPSGRLPITYANHPNDNTLNYYRRFNEVYENVNWEFGHGLSYTKFNYADFKLDKSKLKLGDSLQLEFELKNVGSIPGYETVLVYITDIYRSIAPEVKKLCRFDKFLLQPNQVQKVQFTIDMDCLAFYNADNVRVVEQGAFVVQVGSWNQTITLELEKEQMEWDW